MTRPGVLRGLALASCALTALACAERSTRKAGPAAAAAAGAGEAEPGLHCPGRAVAGFPFRIRLVFTGEAKVPVSTGLLSSDNPFSISLRSVAEGGSRYVFPTRFTRHTLLGPLGRQGGGPEERGVRTFTLREGQTCEVVLDLSNVVCLREAEGGTAELRPFHRLAPGSYKLEVRYPPLESGTPAGRGTGSQEPWASTTVEFAAPSAEEHRLLARLNNLGPVGPVWRAFVLRFPDMTDGVGLAAFSPEASAQLSFHLLMASLVHSDRPVAELQVSDQDIAAPPAACRTEKLVLRYEIELARGDGEAAAKTREEILAARPYAKPALEGIADGRGILGELRSEVSADPARKSSGRGTTPTPSSSR